MRKLIIAAVSAAAVGALGLTATAQAQVQPTSPGPAKSTKISKTVVAGIPAAFTLVKSGKEKCTWKTSGLPSSVTSGVGGANNCTNLIDGVWPRKGAFKVTATVTATGKTTTYVITVTVNASPGENDAVGVGSDTITPLTDQLATDFNSTVTSATATHEYSWDAVNPITGAIGDKIAEKADCPTIVRPDGSSEGIAQLATFAKSSSGPYCTNFARSSRPRASTDPPFAAGGVAFSALASDAVSWSVPAANTSAPKSLTAQQLSAIFTCTDTNWSQVGGKNTPIKAFLPQSGSGTLSFWETALGITPGPCVSNDNGQLEENEGVNPILNNPGTIFIYSVGDYIAQKFHSAKCLNKSCLANHSGVVCKHVPSKNWFFCDVHGTMTPQQINGIAPTVGTGSKTVINPKFSTQFVRTLYNVVPYDPATKDKIPGPTKPVGGVNLEQLFSSSGFDCHSAAAKADIKAYGFRTIGNCGATN